jgi:heat shock protein HslJ
LTLDLKWIEDARYCELSGKTTFMRRFILCVIVMSLGGVVTASDRYGGVDTPGENNRGDSANSIPVSDASEPGLSQTIGTGLEGLDWRLEQFLGGSGEMTPVLAETPVDVRFRRGEISGSAGCNHYFGRYNAGSDRRLTLGPKIGSTQMACPPAVAGQEERYFTLLSRVAAWQRQDGSLLLLDSGHQIILRYIPAKPTALEGSPWQASGINNGRGGVVSSKATHLATALFANGRISGNAGCNQFSASYEIEGNQITIGRAITTRKHCEEPDGIMEQEQQYLQALGRVRTYTMKPDGLELRDENGSLQISYRVQKH